jgi:hypothetical protein
VVAIAAFMAFGCASGPEITPSQEAALEAAADLESARVVGDVAANDRTSYSLPIRFNPSRCPCPDFEIFVFGAWQRVWLDGAPDAVQKARTIARTGGGAGNVRGVLTGATRPSTRSVNYPIFEIQ